MKKLLSVILSLSLITCLFSGCNDNSQNSNELSSTNKPVVSDEDFTPNSETDFVYKEENGEIKITGYKGSSTVVNIPSQIEGKPVTAIGEYAFDGYEAPGEEEEKAGKTYTQNNINSIVSLHIPSSMKMLEEGAFTNCYSLTEVTVSEGLETIQDGAFACCDAIKSISIPDTVKTMGGYVFYECYGMESVLLGKSIESIGDYAFYMCKSLITLELPDSLSSIGTGCFALCEFLSEVKIPSALTDIREYSCLLYTSPSPRDRG